MGRLANLLAGNAARRATDAADATLGGRLAGLRRWQAARLSATYADLAATPRYARAVAFFPGELCGGADFAPHDRDLARAAQLGAILALGRSLDGLVARPGLGLLLPLSRTPARAAGLRTLQAFLERGHGPFRATGGAAEFLATAGARESQLPDGLYRGDPSLLGCKDA